MQADAGLAAASQRGESAAVPAAHGRDVVLVEAFELERLVIELFQFRQRQAEPHTARRPPGRLAVDQDEIDAAAVRRIGPPNFEAALGVLGEQDRGPNLGAVEVNIGKGDVSRVEQHGELQIARVLGEGTAAGDVAEDRGPGLFPGFVRRGRRVARGMLGRVRVTGDGRRRDRGRHWLSHLRRRELIIGIEAWIVLQRRSRSRLRLLRPRRAGHSQGEAGYQHCLDQSTMHSQRLPVPRAMTQHSISGRWRGTRHAAWRLIVDVTKSR